MLMGTSNHQCQRELIAAYVDGELDVSSGALFGQHLQECQVCNEEVKAQRLLIFELDSVLARTPALTVPKNFAQIVAVRAESDVSGVRDGIEHKRALRFCLVLALTSFALLGAAAVNFVFLNGRSMANKVLSILGLLWTSLHDAAIGLIVISRVISGALIPESHFVGFAALLFLALGVVLLSLLISSYHRHHEIRVFE